MNATKVQAPKHSSQKAEQRFNRRLRNQQVRPQWEMIEPLSQSIQAQAFTYGSDIYFAPGRYDPGSSTGQELLAHELTHVVQQSTGQVLNSGSGMTVRPADDSFERQADAIARQSASMEPQPKGEATEAVQRQVDEEME